MVGGTSKKRGRQDGYKRKHDRNKFRRTTNATVHRKDLGNGLQGFLFSCTPHHENQCFRDGVLLLSKFCEDSIQDPEKEACERQKQKQSLDDELKNLRSGEGKLFTRVEGGVTGSVFLKINDDKIDIERVVESALRDARQTGNPGSRHCIRVLPIYTTCYAKAEDAAKAATGVVKDHFPKIEDSPVSYAIAFRARLNSGAKRDDFIPAVAAAIEKIEPRYKVNLTKPDVVLLVEVLKTSCCIGVFRHYYELAKMNLREAACPSKVKESKEKERSGKDNKQPITLDDTKRGTDKDHKADAADALKVQDGGEHVTEVEGSEKTENQPEEKSEQTGGKESVSQKGENEQTEEDEAGEDKGDDKAPVARKASTNGNARAPNASGTKDSERAGQKT